MKAKPKTNPDEKLAAFWGVDIRTIRNWRREGAPLEDEKRMRQWLASRKNIAPGVLRKIQPPAAKEEVVSVTATNGDTGAGHALRRLELSELGAYERLQKALASNDPIAVREARESWLRISESLRRYDLMVEASRRSTAEQVPITQVKTFLRSFLAWMQIAFTLGAEGYTNEIVGKKEPEIYGHIRSLGGQALFMAALGYCHGCKGAPDQRLLDYARECIEAQFSHYPAESKNDLEQRILQIVKWASEEESTIYDNKEESSSN
jgi:hypothetical protein